MMRYLYYFILSLLAVSCTTKYGQMQQALTHMEANEQNYEQPTTDSLALEVATYMELNGTPEERQRAWRQVGLVYGRQDNASYKAEAYRMAALSVDSALVRDTLVYATTLAEWAQTLAAAVRHEEARAVSLRAVSLLEEQGDTAHAMYFRCTNSGEFWGDSINAEKAYTYLWDHGYHQLAVDGYAWSTFITSLGDDPREIQTRLDRLVQYTQLDLTHPTSWAAQDYAWARGNIYMRLDNRDSCLYYYRRNIELRNQATDGPNTAGYTYLADAYNKWGMPDSAAWCYQQLQEKSLEKQRVQPSIDGKMLSQLCQVMRIHQQSQQAASRLKLAGTLLAILVLALVVFLLYRQRMLREQHRALLQQNGEYAKMLSTLHPQDRLLDNPLVQHFHDLSTRDAHPSEQEWSDLLTLVEQQYPRLYPVLSRDYALTEQERRAVALIVAKCTPSQMSVLLVYSKPNVSNLRRRLYQKITHHDGSGTDLDALVAEACSIQNIQPPIYIDSMQGDA